MRSSSGRNSSGNNGGSRGGNSGGRGGSGGGRGNHRGAGNDRDDKQGGRPKKPRPEERRYDVGPGATKDGPKLGPRTLGPRRRQGWSEAAPAARPQRPGHVPRVRDAAPRSATASGTRARRTSSCPRPSRVPSRRASGSRRSSRARATSSRRACEELIEQARVEINGEIVLEQGRRVDPEKDEVKVDGLTVATQSYQFFSLNKPAGVVSTMEDPEGRQCLGDYVTNRETRLFHVGRLDTETEACHPASPTTASWPTV
ncbi:Pseudouridine synthase OS=Streptomyces tendae OX=1932 GN=GUR47_34300 PE=3 SV=1 [Streptomyces tendae]